MQCDGRQPEIWRGEISDKGYTLPCSAGLPVNIYNKLHSAYGTELLKVSDGYKNACVDDSKEW